MKPDSFKLVLVDPKDEMCMHWRRHFDEFEHVEVVRGRFEDLNSFDCMVSAANSFGLMDGGVDLAITKYFGVGLMEHVQAVILKEYLGEQPVGTSFIAETGDPRAPFLAHTPTMRVPTTIARTDYSYQAMFAMLRAVRAHNLARPAVIERVACPGLGTGTGRMPLEEAARQMAVAYAHFLNPPPRIDWSVAKARQAAIGRGGDPMP